MQFPLSACNIGPVTGMFWALHFVKNSSTLLLTSSFSVFLIFRFLFCEQLLSTECIMEYSFFLMFAIVFDMPCCSASLCWLSPFCMHSRTSLFCCKLSSVCNFHLAIFSLMQVQYSRMYCITTNTLCMTENNVRYSALTDWLIYHIAWFRVLNLCLFCWLVNFLLLQLCMYSTFHQWTGRRMAVRFEHEKVIQRDET